jgi:hydroxylamine oxidation protein HaoB
LAATALAPIAKPSRNGRRRSAVSVALAAGGLALLGWFGWRLLVPLPAPYVYQLVAEGKAADFPDLGLKDYDDLAVRKFELRAEGVEGAAAELHVAGRAGAAPVLLGWQSRTIEPVLAVDTKTADVAALAVAVAKHTKSGAKLLTWWDTSRQLKLLAGADVLGDENLARPLLIPGAWLGARTAIEAVERDFWQAAPAGEAEARFERYVDALVSPAPEALSALRELAGGAHAYVVVQLADAYRAGLLRPERFGIGYRDFPNNARLHGAITSVKAWIKDQGYESYAVEAHDEKTTRVYFLTNADSKNALIAKLLPFSSSNPFVLDAPQVVHQHGPYWVYMLPPPA